MLVALDSMSLPVLTKKSEHKIKELKNVEEHLFHPGGELGPVNNFENGQTWPN